MLHHDAHPFPQDIEEMIRELHKLNRDALNELGWAPFDWAAGAKLDEARLALRALIAKNRK